MGDITFNRQLAVAPMMGCTDRHFRRFLRLITRHSLLYTEMITTGALLHGDYQTFLKFSPCERPLALQLGGSNPIDLAVCAQRAENFGYDEVNLNVGCPSDRVQAGGIGACLFKKADLVSDAIHAMQSAVKIPVTLKTRIGVDELDRYEDLVHFVTTVAAAGCRVFIIHARKAWLKGLNPAQNRTVPPLKYDVVYRLKQDFPHLHIIINGGINTLQDVQSHLQQCDGVMVGRSIYDNPFLLAPVDHLLFQQPLVAMNRKEVLDNYLPYVAEQLQQGVWLYRITRHLFGLMQGQPGAKTWRRYLTLNAKVNDIQVLKQALEQMPIVF